jgi:Mrp family chromosome partitioning ATPase
MNSLEMDRTAGPSLLQQVWLRKWSVLAVTALATASAMYFSARQPPIYAGESRVLVREISLPDPDSGSTEGLNMATEQQLAGSLEVARAVRNRLGLEVTAGDLAEDLSVERPGGTEILVVNFMHPDAGIAADGAEAAAQIYLELRRGRGERLRLEAEREAQAKIDALTERLRGIERRLGRRSPEGIQLSLVSRANLLTSLLVQERDGLVALQTPPDVGELIQRAALVGRVAPNHPRNILLGFMLGLALGVAQAGWRGRLDDKVRSVEEAESYLHSTTLGLIPSFRRLEQWESTFTLSSSVPASISEAFVPLRVAFLRAVERPRATTILVTSASAGEGKTTIAANLGVSLARSGVPVTCVCTDSRRHRLERLLSTRADIGLTQVLNGSVPLSKALVPTTVTNLTLLPCGLATDGLAELYHEGAGGASFDLIRERPGYVLIDGSSLEEANLVALVPLVDAVLLVVDANRMRADRLTVAGRQLGRMNAHLVGVVFNRVSRSTMRPANVRAVSSGQPPVTTHRSGRTR